MKRSIVLLVTVAAIAALVSLAAFVSITNASPPAGVTPTVLARGTYPRFLVSAFGRDKVNFGALATSPVDIVVRQHDYAPGGITGWHSHPGPVFITVTQGELTYYEASDRTCSPHVVSAGQGFVDTGGGHFVRNESAQPARDISVIIAPVGGAFRGELPAPNPNCGF
jgi:Cupin domain